MTTAFGKQASIGVQAQMTNTLFILIHISVIGLPIVSWLLIKTTIIIFVKIPHLWKDAKEKMNFFASIRKLALGKVPKKHHYAGFCFFFIKMLTFQKKFVTVLYIASTLKMKILKFVNMSFLRRRQSSVLKID